MKFIKLTLSGCLQSWGEDARWDQRTTSAMPTKSAIIGLLGCSLGIARGSDRLKLLCDQLYVGVRADRPGSLLVDFHTVQGTNGIMLNADGKPRSGSGTIITPKQYLQDACFTVFIWGNDDLLADCFSALSHPKWTLYLGRKSCVPSVPIVPQWVEAASPDDAVASFTAEEQMHSVPVVQVEMDCSSNETLAKGEHMISRRDAVVRADRNEYVTRRVRRFAVQSGGGCPCI